VSIIIDEKKCVGCNSKGEPPCVKYCPGNLIKKESQQTVKLRSGRDCWDCMVCIKVCPREALETRLPYQLATYRASLFPRVEKNKIIWEAKDINGKKEIFESLTTLSDPVIN